MKSTTDKLRELVEYSANERNPAVFRSNRSGKSIKGGFVFDGVDGDGDRMSQHDIESIKMSAAAAVQQWIETDDLSEDETLADRLLAMMIGIADEDQDGELDDDEQDVLEVALECAWDYLAQKGADESDIDTLLNDWDADVAERIRDLVASVLPEGEESDADIDGFAFDSDSESAVMDAAYKMKVAVRKGKKVRIRKRVSGTVRLSAAQKLGLRKARMKAHSAAAKMRRKKSMGIRRKANIK
jgi:hypothetical protein